MTDTLARWRRRCLAAEDRAEAAEDRAAKYAAAAKRLTARCKRLRADLASVAGDFGEAATFARTASRVLDRLAQMHLGADASDSEVIALVDRWLEDAEANAEKARPIAVQIHLTHDELLRRLGFDPFGESE